MKNTEHVPDTFNTFANHINTNKLEKFHFQPRYRLFSPCPATSHNTNNTHNQTQILHSKQSLHIKKQFYFSFQTKQTPIHIQINRNIPSNTSPNKPFCTKTKILSGLCFVIVSVTLGWIATNANYSILFNSNQNTIFTLK